MPVPTDTLWNIRRVNIWFAISALLGLLSMFWMMWHDYARPWRDVQTGYFNVRSALAHFTALGYESPEKRAEYAALKKAVADAEAELGAPDVRDSCERLERDLAEIEGRLSGTTLEYGNQNAEIQVTIFKYEEAKFAFGPDHPTTKRIEAGYLADRAALARTKERVDTLEDAIREKTATLKSLYARRDGAQRALDDFMKGWDDAKKRDQMFGPGWVRGTINFPIIEYAPPKGVPGRAEIKQVFMPDIRIDYNFVESYTTDRCITCHTSIDNPDFSRENFIHQAEMALTTEAVKTVLIEKNEGLVQRLAHTLANVKTPKQGAPRAFLNAFVNAANILLEGDLNRPRIDGDKLWKKLKDKTLDRGVVQSEIETEFRKILVAARPTRFGNPHEHEVPYEEMTDTEREDYQQRLSGALNLYLTSQGRPKIEFKSVLTAHPRLDLFVSPDSPHPMNKMGCSVCHEGSGLDTDFILAAHTPKTPEEKQKWEEKYYWKEAGLPLATFHTIEEFWERPMLQPSYISASCTKCHQEIFDLERHRTERLPAANNIVEGRELFTRNGCINCHNINGLSDSRRVGIDLTYVADKLSAGFMERWIEYPNNFRPSTRMPHFFHQENNLASSANREFDPYPVLRTETEIKAITHYLRTFSRPFDAEPLPDGIQGDPKRGEQLFLSIGCLACHVDMDAHDPLDSAGRTFAEKWIVTDLTHVKARAAIDKQRRESQEPTIEDKLSVLDKVAEAAREDFNRMSKNDRTRYAFRRFTPDRREAALLAKKTEEFLAETQERDPDPFKIYVPPTFVRQGPELSGMGSKLVDDPNNPQQVDRGLRWLYNWLRDPRHYASNTIMPRMFRDNYYQTLPAEERRLKNDQDILDVSAYLIGLRHDTFKADPIPETPEHLAEMQRLILFLLGGQNTASVAEKILNDEVTDPAEPYGALTRAIVAQTYQSFGGGEAGRKKVAALIDARSGSLDERQKLYFGMKMIAHYGCFACHTIAGFEDTTRPGTDMSTWAQKFKSQLDFAFYSHVFHHEREENPEAYENLYRGSTPEDIAEYSHLIRDIAESPEDLLAHIDGQISSAGNVPQHILHNHASFAYHKMRNPRIWDREKYKKPYDKLKMPNFFLSEREAREVTTYLLSRRDPAITEHVRVDYKNTPIGKIARGRALVRRLNCIGCHTIEGGSEATIHQYYTADTNVDDNFPFGPRFKPPLLWGEGAKIQHDWLFGFLNNVEMLRPWLNVRMPSFYLSGEDATTLVEYFAGLAQDESGFLNEYLTPVEKHLKQVSAGQDGADANWFRLDKFKNTSEFLRRYALTHQQVGPYDFDTSQATDDAEKMETLADAFTKVTARGRFLADLFDVAFPFSDPESHTIDDARFKLGEAFFFDQKCLSCHVAGDPSVPGTTKDIKAPNFALTYKRLRYDWLYNWLQDPQAIQPGANMPQIFQGGTAHASLPEDARKEKEDLFGHTVDEQARLLLDFLVSLGERRYTAIQPGALEEAGKAAEEGESEFDFDADESDTEDQEEEFDFD